MFSLQGKKSRKKIKLTTSTGEYLIKKKKKKKTVLEDKILKQLPLLNYMGCERPLENDKNIYIIYY
jgi:hypothetical protein